MYRCLTDLQIEGVAINQTDKSPAEDHVTASLLDADRWGRAYHFALINAAVFVVSSFMIWFAELESVFMILSAPVLFFIGSGLSFLLMIQCGGAIAATSWFVLGSGLFFGLGSMAGGLQFHPWTATVHSDSLYLIHVNLLNACSTVIVLLAAYPLSNMRRLKLRAADVPNIDVMQVMRKYFPVIVFIAAAGVVLKYILFPWADDLLVRSLAAKIYLFIPCCLLLLGLLWKSLDWKLRLLGSALLTLEMFNGLLVLTKYQILAAMLAVTAGFLLSNRLGRGTVSALLMIVIVFFLINPLISIGRAHIDYDAVNNSISERLGILSSAISYQLDVADGVEDGIEDGVKDLFFEKHSATGRPLSDENLAAAAKLREEKYGGVTGVLKGLLIRFDLAPVQGYLFNEYNSGRAGKTLENFEATFIPRVFWPEKPIISRHGPELHKQYFNDPAQIGSSLAPSYSAEAYWNYGPLGVVVVSLLLGLAIGWLTRCSQRAMMGLDPAYFIIAFPVLFWACFVESWIVATYLGEFIIFIVLLLVMRLAIGFWDLLYGSVFTKYGSIGSAKE